MKGKKEELNKKPCKKQNATVRVDLVEGRRQDTKTSVSLDEFKKWGCKCTG